MGKTQTTEDKIAELRAVTREANEVLGDLKREKAEVRRLITSGFAALVQAHADEAAQHIRDSLDDFFGNMKRHNDDFQRAIEKWWAHMSTMVGVNNKAARMVAMQVLRDAGGTMEVGDSKWHMVREVPEADGTSTFAFTRALTRRADDDPKIAAAIEKAVAENNPDMQLLPWPGNKLKGINKQ